MSDFKAVLTENADRVAGMLDQLVPVPETHEARLMEAMRYALLNGGKRVRPFLTVQTASLFDCDETQALRVAAAVEMVHCYSLVHDDLPAMDNDDLRRGKPTCHIKFDDATAILAGDALLTKAFEVVSDPATHNDSHVRADLVFALAKAAGDHGMVGGQMLDLWAEEHTLQIEEITRLQRMKTGALIAVAAEAGAILGKASDEAKSVLHAYAHDIGLAFQIADDLLDVEGDAETVGKQTQKDAEAGKETFVSLLGIEKARIQADMLSQQAARHLEHFGDKARHLAALARFIVERRT